MIQNLKGTVRKRAWRKETSRQPRERGMGRQKKATATACVGSPQLICGESYTEATAKLPENAAITHWGSRVITESFCPHLPTVIRLTAQQLRR